MLTLTHPLLLAGLAALVPLYLLIRRLPPRPRRVRLPTIVLLLAAPPPRAASRRPPPWLLLLRLGAVALLLAGLAGPEWRRNRTAAPAPSRLALVIDNGWAAAAAWPRLRDLADAQLAALPPSARVALIPTAAPPGGRREPTPLVPPAAARAQLAALTPWPWPGDRAAAAGAIPPGASLLWIADGIEDSGAAALRARGGRIAAAPLAGAAILSASPAPSGWRVTLARADEGALEILARDASGRELARAAAPAGAAEVNLPLAPAARPARFETAPFGGPASVFLVPAGFARPRVLIVDGARAEGAPPLLRGAFYVRRALEPFAPIRTGPPAESARADLIVLVDDAVQPGPSADAVLARVRSGAVALSFAGPRTAAAGSALSPAPSARGARALGSVLSWEQPQPIGRFAADGPLAGLPAFPEARVIRQLIGGNGPGVLRWASLADGTPLVTARREGAGLLVLVHTAADPEWSTLPLTGALQAILRRLLPLAANPAALDLSGAKPFALRSMLAADGGLVQPPVAAQLAAADFARAQPSPLTPPGLWRSGELDRPLNLGGALLPADYRFQPLRTGGLRPAEGALPPLRFGPALIAAALLLAAIDGLLAAGLSTAGFAGRLLPRATAAAVLAAAIVSPALAQPSAQALTAIGYVRSGNTAADQAARAGLAALGNALTQRTAVGVGPPQGIDPARPGLGLYPVLYWRPAAPLTPAAATALRQWLDRGGLLLVDPPPGLAPDRLRGLLAPLDSPPLERLTPAHVLARAFYRLEAAPLALGPAPVWVETGTRGGTGRVARLVLASANWPARWTAGDYATRETALRFGVNLMLYALTGDYKADRVHSQPLPPA